MRAVAAFGTAGPYPLSSRQSSSFGLRFAEPTRTYLPWATTVLKDRPRETRCSQEAREEPAVRRPQGRTRPRHVQNPASFSATGRADALEASCLRPD